MENMAFDWQLDEFMVYCRSRQLREKTMNSYEQTLRLFERWCREQMTIEDRKKLLKSRSGTRAHRDCIITHDMI